MNKIREDLLSFVWQYRRIPQVLRSTLGERIQIIHPGTKNTDSGPDFFGAKIKIEETIWAGNVEIHVKTSDWILHNHHHNPSFDSVILHVVFEDDKPETESLKKIPVIELKNHISKKLILKYHELLSNVKWIPCQNNLKSVEQIVVKPWLSRITVERLQNKTTHIREILASTKMDWETSFFQWFSSCFGFKLNNHGFLMLSRSVSYKILMKHSNSLMQIEAILFGQAGLLLNMQQDEYAIQLKKEYDFLAHKYQLKHIDPRVWKFMRTRPGNFPTIRISQLAYIITQMNNLLAEMFSSVNTVKIRKYLQSEASAYWLTHYHFDKSNDHSKSKNLGQTAVDNLIINAVVPFVFLYGDFHDNQKFRDAAINMLEQIRAEDNHILKKWKSLNIKADNAAESQALIELFNEYCIEKRCLSCSIGASLLLDINSI